MADKNWQASGKTSMSARAVFCLIGFTIPLGMARGASEGLRLADLAPPRALGDAGLAPVNCHAPLASADGTRLVLPVDVDGTRTHVRLAAP